jgi:hypothetical protein
MENGVSGTGFGIPRGILLEKNFFYDFFICFQFPLARDFRIMV